MTILEASLRNLVREEATSAALKALEAAPRTNVDLASLQDALLQIIGDASKQEFARLRVASAYRAREEAYLHRVVDAPARLESDQLANCRRNSIELAMKVASPGEDILPMAERIARFIINGELDGKPTVVEQ